jgi:fido (protein-threonine AMPylation protein)
MHPGDCPNWEYRQHRDAAVLEERCLAVLRRIAAKDLPFRAAISDTRPIHRHMFEGLTPSACDYYAGHYRGEGFRCLKYLCVHVGNDSRVGTPADRVIADVSHVVQLLKQHLAGIEIGQALPNSQVSETDKLLYLVRFACLVLCEFMRVHPYANGNGHIGRFLVWSLLTSYGFWPKKWPLHDRPPDPPYSHRLKLYRDGTKEPLETFVLHCIRG